MLFRSGPHIEANTTLQGYVTGNVDFAPTIAEMAGVVPPKYVDGRSMLSLFDAASRPPISAWRSGYLLEFYGYNQQSEDEDVSEPISTSLPKSKPKPEYLGLRTTDYLYVEYQDGFVELYDLKTDPYEMENIAATADKSLLQHLSEWLHALSTCAGQQCSTLDQDTVK